jgi:hypothetical protein
LIDIKEFYLGKGIIPRIYQPSITGYFEGYRAVFEDTGYEVKVYGNNQFTLLKQDDNSKKHEILCTS